MGNYYDMFDFVFKGGEFPVVGRTIGFFKLANAYEFAITHDMPWVRHTFRRTFLSELEEEYIQLY